MMSKSIGIVVAMMFLFSMVSVIAYGDIQQPLQIISADGKLEIEVITGGLGISAIIRNTGNINATNVSWTIETSGGFILLGKQASGMIPRVFPNFTTTVKIPLVLGIGQTQIRVTVESSEGGSAEMVRNARVHIITVKIIPGDVNGLRIRLDRIAQRLHAPTVLTNAGDGTNRLFVGEQTGKIFVI
ncbi:MAG: hypothetical protein KKG04_06845 [Candidatus Thermoplasmatota archaeon]|nr:hypothetical protein [Candidatus Thermoplasmatota archaeon]